MQPAHRAARSIPALNHGGVRWLRCWFVCRLCSTVHVRRTAWRRCVSAVNKSLDELISEAAKHCAPNSEYDQAVLRTFWIRRLVMDQSRMSFTLASQTAQFSKGGSTIAARHSTCFATLRRRLKFHAE